jgi:hypothetical protein
LADQQDGFWNRIGNKKRQAPWLSQIRR